MINKPPTPPDQAKTVRHNKRTHFEHFNDNDDQRAVQSDASNANSNFARAELIVQQPMKSLPTLEPLLHRCNCRGLEQVTKLIISSPYTKMATSSKPEKTQPVMSFLSFQIQCDVPDSQHHLTHH